MIDMKHAVRQLMLLVFCVMALPACAQQEDDPEVRSFLNGVIMVDETVDATPDYRGFEVLVAVEVDGEPDTLGFGVTDSTGAFAFDVVAPSRGRYSLIVSRRGQILTVGALAVAEADSATLRATFPLGNRPLRVRSMENSAWLAYENTTALHRQGLLDIVQGGEYTESKVSSLVHQTSTILWNLQETFPGTMGSEVAAAEAVTMVTSWNDSLALERAQQIPPENLNYVNVAQAARVAQARVAGQESAIALLEEYAAAAQTEEQVASLRFEIIAARLDSSEYELSLELARAFKDDYADTPYEEWGTRAIYELENLIPGRPAPLFSVRTVLGDSLHLEDFHGQQVLLEFYHPQDDTYEREIEGRNRLRADAPNLEIVSISVAPDTLINEAFFDGRTIPGQHVFNPVGLAPLYNVNVVPTRFLIDAEGAIVAKYVGSTMQSIYNDVLGVQ